MNLRTFSHDWFLENKSIIILSLFYSVALVFILAYLAHDLLEGGNGWKQGDWLINNSSSLVRRGWMGSFFLQASTFLHTNPVFLVALFQGIVTIALFFSFWIAGLRLKNNDVAFFLLLSPLFLLFWFNDPAASMRKEILAYFSFLPLIILSLTGGKNPFFYISASMILYFVAVFSHEANVFFSPFYIFMIYILRSKVDRALIISSIIFLMISFAGGLYSIIYPSVESFMDVCNPILDAGADKGVCDGAMKWLERKPGYALDRTVSALFNPEIYKFLLSYFFILSFLIFLLNTYFSISRLLAFLLFSSFLFLPLYMMAVDWGRWLNFFVFSVTAVFLAFIIKNGDKFTRKEYDSKTYLGLFLFCVSWGVMHVGGYFSLEHGFFYGLVAKSYEAVGFLLSN